MPIKFSRHFEMPTRWTFEMKPVARLIQRYVGDGADWIDPFAGQTSPAELTNDLNPNMPTRFHMKAEDFAKKLANSGRYSGILFDPPYSNRQIKECYESIGLKVTQEDTQALFQREKKLFTPLIQLNGYAICFGWNTNGFGKYSGFELKEVMMVYQGIVTGKQRLGILLGYF